MLKNALLWIKFPRVFRERLLNRYVKFEWPFDKPFREFMVFKFKRNNTELNKFVGRVAVSQRRQFNVASVHFRPSRYHCFFQNGC